MNQLNFDLGSAPGIKPKRPCFNNNYKWDVTIPRLKKLVDEYIQWCDGWEVLTADRLNRHEYEDDIISCLNEHNEDGYHLAKHLEEKTYVDADAELVDMLGDIAQIKRNIKTEATKKWVKDHDMKLPDNISGRKCTFFIGFVSDKAGIINGLRPETYEVVVKTDDTKHSTYNSGYIVPFENITFID